MLESGRAIEAADADEAAEKCVEADVAETGEGPDDETLVHVQSHDGEITSHRVIAEWKPTYTSSRSEVRPC
jgi:hypothetical protein